MSKTNNHKLFEDFKASSHIDWEQQVAKDLKTEDWKSKLLWKTSEGYDVPAFFSSPQASTSSALVDHAALNYDQPALGARHWFNVQKVEVTDSKKANAFALVALNSGADGILFKVNSSSNLNLEILLQGILPQFCWIGFEFDSEQDSLREEYFNYLKSQKIELALINGIFIDDIISEWSTQEIKIDNSAWDKAFEIIKHSTKNLPIFNIDGRHFHNAGGNMVQELAFILSVATEYIHQLTERGIMPKQAIQSLSVTLAVGGSYFMEIAKIRALRILFNQLSEAYHIQDFNPADLKIHSTSSTWNKTFLEPYTNMLRNTTEAMSAILGGCNSLCIDSFDESFRNPEKNAQRWSRNVSTILKEESYFDKVADPSAGAYYINYLSESLASHAWLLFKELEENGGYIASFELGKIQQLLNTSKDQKLKKINTRRQILVGANQYPYSIENPASGFEGQTIKSNLIRPSKAALDFEELRLKIKNLGDDKTPSALIITLSNQTQTKARIDFSKAFFAAGGFKIDEAATTSHPAIAIICGADEDYLVLNSEKLDSLKKQHPNKIWVLAGQPPNKELLKAAGIDHFIFMNADVPAVLNAIHSQILFNL